MKDPRDDISLDPDAPASEEELAAAEALRLALEDPSRQSHEADLARALSLAHAPREIPEAVNAALISKSLDKMAAKRVQRGRVIRVTFGAVTSALAIAAAAVLLIRATGDSPQMAIAPAPIPLVQVRSTAPLFHEPFATAEGLRADATSARIDRIALARADDLRENRYAAWGVK